MAGLAQSEGEHCVVSERRWGGVGYVWGGGVPFRVQKILREQFHVTWHRSGSDVGEQVLYCIGLENC